MRSLRLLLVLLACYPALAGYGGPNPFHVAPLQPSGGNYAPGEWVESSTLSSADAITIVIMASWCPHCARMIDQLAADPAARRKVDMVLFFEDDGGPGARAGQLIKYPAKIAGRDLPYYLAKQGEFAGLCRGFPTILSCSRQVCTEKSRADLGLR
jgi:thiol-disulfide isomerase/thioredoxin